MSDSETYQGPSTGARIAAVLAELPAIGKDSQAPAAMGGYSFRGIEDVLNKLNPLLSKHGLFFTPRVIERAESLRQTSGGKPLYVVNLLVEYTFHSEDVSVIRATVWGEGSDTGDKATQKAMTSALKYMLFQVFAISTQEGNANDLDRGGEEPALTPVQQRKLAFEQSGAKLPEGWESFEQMDESCNIFAEGAATLSEAQRAELAQHRKDSKIAWPPTADEFNSLCEFVAKLRNGAGGDFAEPAATTESEASASA